MAYKCSLIHVVHPALIWFFPKQRPFYFVTFNTYRRLPLLARPEINEAFCSFCVRAKEHGVAVGKYVLMPDHAHLFVALHTDVSLGKWVKALRSVMGKKWLALGFRNLIGKRVSLIISSEAGKAIRRNGITFE
jgi:REP element-mobilizing transposase RayT